MFPLTKAGATAGFWGSVVYLNIIMLDEAHELGGLVPVEMATALARYLRMHEADFVRAHDAAILQGLAHAVDAGLLELTHRGERSFLKISG